MISSITRITRIIQSFLALAIALVGFRGTAFIVESHEFDEEEGLYTYTYQVHNTENIDLNSDLFDISAWSLEFFVTPDWNQNDVLNDPPGDVGVPVSMSDWLSHPATPSAPQWIALAGTPSIGLYAQDFVAVRPIDDIVVNSILGGFSFTSAFAPGSIPYFEFGSTGARNSGLTVGPVPEPGTWLLFAFVLASLLLCQRLQRRLTPLAADRIPADHASLEPNVVTTQVDRL